MIINNYILNNNQNNKIKNSNNIEHKQQTMKSVFRQIPLIQISQSMFTPHYVELNSPSMKSSRKSTSQTSMERDIIKAKNNKSIQQSFLIGFLCFLNYKITIQKLYKKGSKQMQLFIIKYIHNKSNQIIYSQTSNNLNRKDLDASLNNLLISLIENETKAMCEFTNGKKAKKTQQFKIIKSLKINNKTIGQDIIENCGRSLFDILLNKNDNCESDFVCDWNDFSIINIITTQLHSLNLFDLLYQQ